MPRSFDRKSFSRNRVVAWDPALKNGDGGAVTVDDLMTDEKYDAEKAGKYGVAEADAWRFTPERMGEPYSTGDGKAMLAALALSRDETEDDTLVQLCLQARGNDLYNQSLSDVRPVKVTEANTRKAVNVISAVMGGFEGLSDEEKLAKLTELMSKGGRK